MAGALALSGLAISGAGPAGAVPIEEDSDQRIAGADRYSTSADISATIEDEAGDIETLVVASGENFPDALAAAGLTHNDGATPAAILLVESDSIPASVLAQMNRIDDSVTQVYVVGGEAAISDDVVADIEDIFGDASVDRIAGDNRYETAIRVADEIGHDGTVILASGTSFADAITVGAWASANATPILLANADGLPTETEDELSDLIDGGDGVVDRVIIVGGTAAVGSVEEDLVDMGLAPAGVSRVAGANRYATNLQWNVENFSTQLFTPKALTAAESQNLYGVTQLYASGANYPDALAAAPLAAELEAHVILVDPVSVGASALTLATVGKTAITVDNSTIGTQVRSAIYDGAVNDGTEEFFGQNVWVIGGTNAVPTSVMSTIEGASAQSLGCSVILRKANDNDDLTGDGMGPVLAIVSWVGNLQTDEEMDAAGEIDPDEVLEGTELYTLLDVDEANDLVDVEGTTIDGAIGLDLDEDGFADAVLYTFEDALAEGDTVEFTGIEV
ncbi:MAG: cell wall-binding repeat-containing protein, partial [Ilumatobacteraceae bacterium]